MQIYKKLKYDNNFNFSQLINIIDKYVGYLPLDYAIEYLLVNCPTYRAVITCDFSNCYRYRMLYSEKNVIYEQIDINQKNSLKSKIKQEIQKNKILYSEMKLKPYTIHSDSPNLKCDSFILSYEKTKIFMMFYHEFAINNTGIMLAKDDHSLDCRTTLNIISETESIKEEIVFINFKNINEAFCHKCYLKEPTNI